MQIIPDETTLSNSIEEGEIKEEQIEPKSTALSNKTVLIVIDDDNLRQMYVDIFSANGFTVVQAKDGIEGLDSAGKESVGLVFTAVDLPRMNGVEMVRSLKESPATQNLPIFVISRLGREEDQQEMEKLGVNEFIGHGTIPPAEIVKKILRLYGADKFSFAIDFNQLDGSRFLQEYGDHRKGICPDCERPLALKIETSSDTDDHRASFSLECANSDCVQQKQVKKEDGTIMEITR